MFRRAANLLSSVADVLDDMLAADFEYELEDWIDVADADAREADHAWSDSAATAVALSSFPSPATTCEADGRRRRLDEAVIPPARRAGAVPRPVEYCLTPVPRRAHGDDSAASSQR